jgi:hypothetical protein
MKVDMRNANIGIGVGVVVLIVGCALFRNSGEDAIQAVGVAMLIATFATIGILDNRDESRPKRPKRNQ